MWNRLRGYLPAAMAGLFLLALACQAESEAVGSPAGAAPDVQATITALEQQRSSFSTPTPSPVPQSAREAAQKFAEGFQQADRKWDQLHLSYDTWRAGLVACNPTSVRASLGRFAAQFAAISRTAGDLPRASATREFADRISRAAGIEAQALATLRDNWQPGEMTTASEISSEVPSEDSLSNETADGSDVTENPGPVSAFGQLDRARATTADLIRGVSDNLTDLEERNTESGRAEMEDFTLAFQALNLRWDTFHQDYDTFRAEEVGLTSNQVVARLSELVSGFAQVVIAARELPKLSGTRPVAQLLSDTADAEDLALRQLRATFQKEGNGGDASGNGDEEADTGNGSSNGRNFVATDSSLFQTFEGQLVASNTSRRQAIEEVADLNLSLSEERIAIVSGFNEQYQPLLSDWSTFHRDFDDWRLSGGGCDREAAIRILVRLGTQLNQISTDVGGLPNTSVLRPLGELLVEAVGRESSALTNLRDAWQPFDVDIYQPLRQERGIAEKLRRQVAVGIQDLLEQYGPDES